MLSNDLNFLFCASFDHIPIPNLLICIYLFVERESFKRGGMFSPRNLVVFLRLFYVLHNNIGVYDVFCVAL